MANRKATKKSKRKTQVSSPSSSIKEPKELKEVVREMISHPAIKYVASGLATAILTKVATGLSERYPEIASFIKDNIDHFENDFRGFQDSGSQISSRSKH